ncbi:MAG TPA: helical backbone metal receptor, partial [Burkholderiales bacterium]|nr:helical backbone metal receptor [Burkholderiales bacterium]
NITELLYAAGAGPAMVGAVEYSDYPPEASKLERVGNAQALDIEKIASLHPDLVVAWRSGNPPLQVRQIENLGIPVFHVDPEHLSDIPIDVEKLGRLSGTEETARIAARSFRSRLEILQRRYSGKSKVKIFY